MIISLVPSAFLKKEDLEIIEKNINEKILVYNSPQEAMNVLPDAEIIIAFGSIDKNTIRTCRNLKWLFSISAGVEKYPLTELREMGVTVTNSRGVHGPQVAEQTMGMIIAFSRSLNRSIRNQLQKKWVQLTPVDELTGKILCVIGAGSIGKEIARKAKAFDLKVIGIKKHPEALDHFDEVLGIDKLSTVLPQADYIVLITPLTAETFHLIDEQEFKIMKNSSIFINVSRGDTVNEEALIEALQKGYIAGAGLDVFHEEPLPQSNPLWEMENVIITPHNGGISPNSIKKIITMFSENLKLYRKGEPIPNQIDLTQQY